MDLSINKSDSLTLSESNSVNFDSNFLSVFFDSVDIGGLPDVNITAVDIHLRPAKGVTTYKLARQDGSKLVNAEYNEKIINLRGHIAASSRTNYELERDILIRRLQTQEATLQIVQASSNRNYTATVRNIIWSFNGGGYGVFDIEFVCSNPFGQDVATTTLLNAVNITTDTNQQTIAAIAGTFKSQPVITVAVVSLTGGTNKYIKITNPNNSKGITITRTWAASDSLVIDCLNQTAKVNGTLVDYTGVFPEWAIGNTLVQYDDNLTTRSVNLSFVYSKRYL